MLRALTLRHPWPFAICALGKDIENRTWQPALRLGTDIAIHGGKVPTTCGELSELMDVTTRLLKTYEPETRAWMASKGLDDITLREVLSFTGIVAIVRFDGAVTSSDSLWFEGPIGWQLGNVRVLREPIPCKGAQCLWQLPGDIEYHARGMTDG